MTVAHVCPPLKFTYGDNENATCKSSISLLIKNLHIADRVKIGHEMGQNDSHSPSFPIAAYK